jgi:hypothetical protein
MARQVADRRLTLTAAVRASVIAQAAELARKRGVPVSRIVDEILAEFFEQRASGDCRRSGLLEHILEMIGFRKYFRNPRTARRRVMLQLFATPPCRARQSARGAGVRLWGYSLSASQLRSELGCADRDVITRLSTPFANCYLSGFG